MASNQTTKYPYIPTNLWWALRRRFKSTLPTAAVTSEYLSSVLDTTIDNARKNVLAGLKLTGLVDDEGKVTDLCRRWRADEEYGAVCFEILEAVYPEELIHANAGADVDRDRLENWFQRRTTLGKARIKAVAGFYELLAEADPSRENEKTQRASGTATGRSQRSAPRTNDKPATHRAVVGVPATEPPSPNVTIGVAPSVHIDMHFHVSPESPPDQIDKIFESMARHLKLRENANGE